MKIKKHITLNNYSGIIEMSDGSRYFDGEGSFIHYYKNGEIHNENGPAVVFGNGEKQWWLNGKLHREDGVACEFSDGSKYWYLNNRAYSEEKWKIEVGGLK